MTWSENGRLLFWTLFSRHIKTKLNTQILVRKKYQETVLKGHTMQWKKQISLLMRILQMFLHQQMKATKEMVWYNPCIVHNYFAYIFVVKRSKAEKSMSPNISNNGSSSNMIDLSLLLPDGKCCLVKVIACYLYFKGWFYLRT